jgi:hypothetical protein
MRHLPHLSTARRRSYEHFTNKQEAVDLDNVPDRWSLSFRRRASILSPGKK